MLGTFVRLVGGQLVKVLPSSAAKRIIAELIKNGGKITRFPKGKPPSATNVTANNLNKIIQGGRGKPSSGPKNVTKPNAKPTTKPKPGKKPKKDNVEQFGPGGSAPRPITKPKQTKTKTKA